MHSVSVIIPAYNAVATIAETIGSVQAQTVKPLEIIVVDDGSTDGTPALLARLAAEDPLIRVIRQPNAGVAKARNVGVTAARGDWIGAIDNDDIWHPRWIERMLAAAEAAPQRPGFVYCWSRRIDAESIVISDMGRPTHQGNVFEKLVVSNFLQNASAALLRRDAVLAVGGFDPGLQAAGAFGAEDIKLYLSIARTEPVAVAPCFLTGYRISANSMSRSVERTRASIEFVLRDLESTFTDIPPSLMQLARMNYDLYVAAVALSNRNRALFLRYVMSAVMRAPFSAATLLAIHALWRTTNLVFPRPQNIPFKTLEPDEHVPMVLASTLDRYQAWLIDRAVQRRALPLRASRQG